MPIWINVPRNPLISFGEISLIYIGGIVEHNPIQYPVKNLPRIKVGVCGIVF